MKRVFKFGLQTTDRQEILMPKGWKPLMVGVQEGRPFIWCEIDEDAVSYGVTFFIHGTGHELHPDAKRHLGSYMLLDGQLVFHVFTTE